MNNTMINPFNYYYALMNCNNLLVQVYIHMNYNIDLQEYRIRLIERSIKGLESTLDAMKYC